jgi:hypothetical protein
MACARKARRPRHQSREDRTAGWPYSRGDPRARSAFNPRRGSWIQRPYCARISSRCDRRRGGGRRCVAPAPRGHPQQVDTRMQHGRPMPGSRCSEKVVGDASNRCAPARSKVLTQVSRALDHRLAAVQIATRVPFCAHDEVGANGIERRRRCSPASGLKPGARGVRRAP